MEYRVGRRRVYRLKKLSFWLDAHPVTFSP